MANEPTITIVGNTTDEAQLRYTASGAAVASWTLVSTPRVKQGDTWTDGEPTFYRCSAWRSLGETAAESITKGMRLVVTGRFKTRSYETSAGEKRLSLEVDVDEVGASMRYATVKVNKVERNSGGFGERRPTGTDGIQGGSYEAGDPWGAQPAGESSEPAPF